MLGQVLDEVKTEDRRKAKGGGEDKRRGGERRQTASFGQLVAKVAFYFQRV